MLHIGIALGHTQKLQSMKEALQRLRVPRRAIAWFVGLLLVPLLSAAETTNILGINPPGPDSLPGRFTVVLVTILAVVLCVFVHYESLTFLTGAVKKLHIRLRLRILVLIFAILGTHVIEIWIFGGAYYFLASGDGSGALVASHPLGLLDHIYFSAVCFTTLGLGDIIPMGAIRFMTGTEALTGFVLITWSASFTYMEMERFWRQ